MNQTQPNRIENLTRSPSNIRNISVVAPVDHGKHTIIDNLLAFGFIKNQEINEYTDVRMLQDEKNHFNYLIQEAAISLLIKVKEDLLNFQGTEEYSDEFLCNIIHPNDSRNQFPDMESDLKMADGCLIVFDCIEGLSMRIAQEVFKNCAAQKIKPVLLVNKIDRAFLELQLEYEEIYSCFSRIIESMSIFFDQDNFTKVSPEIGTIIFASGLHGWGFSIQTFARKYANKFGVKESILVKKLWGDNFFDKKTKKWSKSNISSDGRKLERGFCLLILDPIQKIFTAIMGSKNVTEEQYFQIKKMANQLGLKITDEEFSEFYKSPKQFLKIFLRKWLPLSDCLSEAIVTKLPSPLIAQKYRNETLYSGTSEEFSNTIRNCDPKGPLVIFISKKIFSPDFSQSFSFGRIFSGTITAEKPIFILGPQYSYEEDKKDKFQTNIDKVEVLQNKKLEPIESLCCGNLVLFSGQIDSKILNTATIVDKTPNYILSDPKYSSVPVMRLIIEPKPEDLSKFDRAFEKLKKIQPLLIFSNNQYGEYYISSPSEILLENSLFILKEYLLNEIEIITKGPFVEYRETIVGISNCPYNGEYCMAKSPNKHNRLYVELEPLKKELIQPLEEKEYHFESNKQKGIEEFKKDTAEFWEPNEPKRIWSLGLSTILIDCTEGVNLMHEIRDSIESIFEMTQEGVLIEEPLRGIKIKITHAQIASNGIFTSNGAGQIMPSFRRVIKGALLTAQPRFLEPIYLIELTSPSVFEDAIYSVLAGRRGTVVESKTISESILFKIHLPVADSFGFKHQIRSETRGEATDPQFLFSHFDLVPGDPLEENSTANLLMQEIRKQKGLSENIPKPEDYLDKI